MQGSTITQFVGKNNEPISKEISDGFQKLLAENSIATKNSYSIGERDQFGYRRLHIPFHNEQGIQVQPAAVAEF